MTVLANGNVGIGAISPTEKLHIEGTSSQSLLLKATGIGNHANLKLEPGASTGRALISSGATGASFFFQTGVNYPLQIDSTNFGLSVGSGVGYAQTANSAPANGMIVQGSVGIGTTAPGAKLQTNTSSIGTIGQIIKWGQAGQTANLLELQNNTGTVLSRIDKDGKFYGDGSGLTGVIASVTSDANNNTKAGTGSLNALAAGGNDNTAYGYNSLSNLTTGDNNVAVGRTAGSAISSGQNNIALGMYSMGGGDINSAVSIGTNAMGVASSSYSVAIGEYAMYNGASGSSVAVGFRTLEAAGSGALLNTAVGSYALQGLTTGDNNTALGNMAGQTSTPANEVTTGSNNTFIGYDSGPGTATQLSNATAIGANARVTTSNSLILGSGANVGIGTNSPANPISVVSPTDNSTIASFGNAINSAKVEVQSMGAGQSQKLVFTGTSSSQILSISPTSGSSNMMNIDNKGEGILFSSGSFGNNTTLFGIFDFRANNSSTGMNASSGIQSYMRVEPKVDQSGTAGYTGLLVNATQTSTGSGTKNLIDLQLAGTSQFRVTNDGFVYNNGQIVSLGAGTFYGPLAAQTMVSAMNLGIANGTVSEFNIFGYNAGYAAFKKWSSVATEVIDNSANAEKADMKFNVLDNGTFSEKMRITNTGNVGIGAASPQAALDVVSTGTSSAVIVPRATTGNRPTTLVNGMIRYNTTTTLFEFYQNGVWVNYTTVSDGRLKTNVEPVTDGLKLVNQLNPVFYDWDQSNPKTSGFEDRHQVGFIAQEVEKVLPEVVNKGEDGYRSLEYGKMVSVVIAAVKELYIKALGIDRELASIKAEKADKAEVSQLKSENEKLKKENTAIKAYLCAKDPKAAICK